MDEDESARWEMYQRRKGYDLTARLKGLTGQERVTACILYYDLLFVTHVIKSLMVCIPPQSLVMKQENICNCTINDNKINLVSIILY